MRFSQELTTPKPAGFLVLEPAAFADDWHQKPDSSVAVGLSPLSEANIQIVKAEAARFARDAYPDLDTDDPTLNEAFHDRMVTLAVAMATCSPNDAREPFFPCPEEEAPAAWRSATIRRLWDELERVTVATSPVTPEATAEDLAELPELLPYADKLSMKRGARLRKMLAYCIEELRTTRDAIGEL